MGNIIALGTFDGVHLGHQRLIRTVLEMAKQENKRPLIYTFSNHPLEAFGRKTHLVMSNKARIALLSTICETVSVPFDRVYAAVEPRDFVRLLLEEYSLDTAVGGFNYTFGNHGAGDMDMLRTLGAEMGFQVCEIPPQTYKGETISSTRIRRTLEAGQVEDAGNMLGRPFSMETRFQGMDGPALMLESEAGLALPAQGTYGVRLRKAGAAPLPGQAELRGQSGEKAHIRLRLEGAPQGLIPGTEMILEFLERISR